MEASIVYIFWTCRDLEEGKKIARGLLEKRWIACATFIPHVESLYRWEDQIEEGKEVKAILKTRRGLFEKIRTYIQEQCSYKVPEIAELPLERVHPPYRDWVLQETSNL